MGFSENRVPPTTPMVYHHFTIIHLLTSPYMADQPPLVRHTEMVMIGYISHSITMKSHELSICGSQIHPFQTHQ